MQQQVIEQTTGGRGRAGVVMVLALAGLLAGCGTLEGVLANRVSCSLDRKVGYVNSMYGPIGLTSVIHKDDSAVMCAPPVAAAASASSPKK